VPDVVVLAVPDPMTSTWSDMPVTVGLPGGGRAAGSAYLSVAG